MSFRTLLHRMMAASILLGLLNSSPAVGQGIDAKRLSKGLGQPVQSLVVLEHKAYR